MRKEPENAKNTSPSRLNVRTHLSPRMFNQHVLSEAVLSPHHSTLELAKHDKAAGAPERDHAGAAPENRRDQEALQVRDLSL